MKKISNIFLSVIVLLVYFLCAPSFGAINDVALNGGEEHAPGVLQKHKVPLLADLPAVAREKISQHLQQAEYEVSRCEKALPSGKPSSYRAPNRKQNLNAYFTSQGVHVLPTGQGTPVWHLEMHFSGYGYDGAMRQAKQERLDAIEVSGNRVEYQRGTLTEWYMNDEQGLEQGMTLDKAPDGKGTGPLVIEWTVSGNLEPRVEPQGSIIFRKQDGEAVLTYGGLEARDATGRSLPAKLSLNVRSSRDAQTRIAYTVDDSNASYPVIIDPLFTRPKKLIPTGGKNDHFGYSVSISGGTVVVGAYGDGDNGYNSGAAYIFARNQGGANNWGQVKKITPSDGAPNDNFGCSVSISGDTVVLGAYREGDRGAAYVFERDEGGSDNWGQVQKITASDGAVGDSFGYSVSISGDTVVVGAYEDDNDNGDSSGSAYIFYRDQGGTDNWGEVKKKTASDGQNFGQFGYSVSIDRDTLAVGGPNRNAAYIFDRDEGGADHWEEVKKITSSECLGGCDFGWSVSIGGDTVVVGAVGYNHYAGCAYIFERNAGGTNNWGEIKKITASDGVLDDMFGCSVSISGDTVVVGANQWPNQWLNHLSGYAYIFYRDEGGGDNWGEVRKITPGDGAEGDEFGASVAISGDTVIIGAHLNDENETDSGSSYVYYRDKSHPDNWDQVKKIIGRGGGAAGDEFGYSVSISDETVVVGAHLDKGGDFADMGSAYIFYRDESNTEEWIRAKKIRPALSHDDHFGCSVSISGDTVVAGAEGYLGGNGRAFIFYRDQGVTDNWGEVKHVSPDEGFGTGYFGYSISISGDTLVVGAYGDSYNGIDAGSAYVFDRNEGGSDNWGQVKLIRPSDGNRQDRFGSAVSISGDTVVVGARYDDDNGFNSGSIYFFDRNEGGANNWGQVKKITASDGAAYDSFGYSVSISGDTTIVGAAGDDDNGDSSGSAYIFYRDRGGTDNWGEVKKITASDGAESDLFGLSVFISGETLVVGAIGDDDNGSHSGSAYVFSRDEGVADNWGEVQKLTASDGAEGDYFGRSVSMDNETLVVGANGDDANGTDSGSAYVYIAIDICNGDFDTDGDVDGADLAAYIADDRGVSLAVLAGEFGLIDCP